MSTKSLALVLALSLSAGASHAGNLHLIVGSAQIEVQAPAAYSKARITLADPNGGIHERVFTAAQGGRIDLSLGMPIDGAWRYSLVFDGMPAAVSTRGPETTDGRREAGRAALPVVSGSFGLSGGAIARRQQQEPRAANFGKATDKDQVIADDLIVIGSACVGLDCVNNENFGFDTLRLKENNVQIHFEDTSNSAGFPGDDWTLIANESANGGANKFSIENRTAGTLPFTVIGAAPSNSLFIDASGRVGFRTPTPALDLHLVTPNTPALRLEQSGAGGFTAQTWDLSGNEANFFVRDVTNGSRLPFRIRPGAPTSSIDIAANGNVSFGGSDATARIEARTATALGTPAPMLRVFNSSAADGVRDRFTVDSTGNVTARGTISQLSSRATKENFETLEGPLLLAKLEQLSVPAWNYRDAQASERHIGPVAEDFHATFGVGADPRFLAPGDVAGVALASVKALQNEIKQRGAHIEALEARLQRLEALLVEPR